MSVKDFKIFREKGQRGHVTVFNPNPIKTPCPWVVSERQTRKSKQQLRQEPNRQPQLIILHNHLNFCHLRKLL